MRWLFIFHLLIFCTCSFSYSQEITYGIKEGLNLSDVAIQHYVNPDAEANFRIKVGLHAGVFASVPVAERFLLSAELLYSNKGVKAADRINLRYFNIPFLVQYKITDAFIVEGGPELGYLFSARSKYGSVSNTWNNKLDFGLNAGIKYSINEKIGAGARYGFGFLSVINNVDDTGSNYIPAEQRVSYQNRVVQFYLTHTLGKILVKN
jgi:hypothetical protein